MLTLLGDALYSDALFKRRVDTRTLHLVVQAKLSCLLQFRFEMLSRKLGSDFKSM